jgi:hypothetical protein
MKEQPILFTGEMVRALLNGRKTQTRRVTKPQPNYPGIDKFIYQTHPFAPSALRGTPAEGKSNVPEIKTWLAVDWAGNICGELGKCPYGVPGDRLWVRETWAILALRVSIDQAGISYRADGELSPDVVCYPRFLPKEKRLQADRWFAKGRKWHPSIFMPRWASRILLEITDIRAERLQDISIDDCIAEGVPQFSFARGILSESPPDPRWKFIELWDSINAKRGYPWEDNPWVWVIEFKMISPERN